jgi:hypothetical protein
LKIYRVLIKIQFENRPYYENKKEDLQSFIAINVQKQIFWKIKSKNQIGDLQNFVKIQLKKLF